MSFFAVALKNLLRRRLRSLLTVAGVAAAVAAVIVLVTLAWGFERTWLGAFRARGADLLVGRASSRRPVPSPFPARVSADLVKLPEVEEAAGMLSDIVTIEDTPAMLVFGWEPGSFLWDHLRLVRGRWPAGGGERTVALGLVASQVLGKRVGDTVQIDTTGFVVCGIFASDSMWESGTVLMSLQQLQAVSGCEGLVNIINVKLKPDAYPSAAERLRRVVSQRFPGFSVYTADEAVQRNVGLQAAKALTLAISLVTLVVGMVGVTNTMVMSVSERLPEIAVLLAIGWRRARIVRLILVESLVITVAGSAVGTLAGLQGLRALQWGSWFRGRIDVTVSLPLLAAVVAGALALGVAAGLYPAWIGARMQPVDGLRHE
jgi:putative ABC transport system permease protein